MIRFLWPWAFFLLPLPWIIRRWYPPARSLSDAAIRVPFFDELKKIQRVESGGARKPALIIAYIAWLLLLAAAARPQWLGTPASLPITGRDLMLVIDISGSMRRIDFVFDDEMHDRLSIVKMVAGHFIERRKGDRLGLILFGARPYLRAPLSHDHLTIKALLEEAEVALAGEYTAIGDAIGLAIKRMREQPSQSRVIVLLTDGANNTGNIGPKQAALLAAQEGIRVYTIGVGKQDEAAPNPYGSWTAEGAANFDRETLKAIADITGGIYFHALDTRALESAYQQLDKLEPALGGEVKDYLATPLYPWPLAGAMLLSVWMAFNSLTLKL